jgi:hypothetical protein
MAVEPGPVEFALIAPAFLAVLIALFQTAVFLFRRSQHRAQSQTEKSVSFRP